MLSISPALGAAQAQNYHKLEFSNATHSYYKQAGAIEGEWQGQLATKLGLSGLVDAKAFARLTEGRNPLTDAEMVRHRQATNTVNSDGTISKAVEHRAGWDGTFSAPKSVSLTALVGGDEGVREAHRAAVSTALTELEKYIHARIGGNNPSERTGKMIAAKFEHDLARPVDGYAAPQLHTHAVIFNVTEREDGKTRALDPRPLFQSKSFATAVYQSALTYELRNRGYEIETGRSGAPEIKGYSQEYLDASSLRSEQIRERLEQKGYSSPKAAAIAALETRDRKQVLSPGEIVAAHKAIAEQFGNQPAKVIEEAKRRGLTTRLPYEELASARNAVAHAKSGIYEREAVADEREVLRDALRRGMGETTYASIRAEFDQRRLRGEFRQVAGSKHDSGPRFTTPETLVTERATIQHVMRGVTKVEPIMAAAEATAQSTKVALLNITQQQVIAEVLTTSDRVHGLQGLAGTGKTTVLASIRAGAEEKGFIVQGFAPTSRAAGQLREAGIGATTLQSFLARNQETNGPQEKRLYMLDESSLASSKLMRKFLDKMGSDDRVLVIGDVRQHQSVDAGTPFQQMQDAGMRTSQLTQIVRQKDAGLLAAVQQLAIGQTQAGMNLLAEQGRITEIANPKERITALAKDYTASPEGTLIIAPDNRSRVVINDAVRVEMRATGTLSQDGLQFAALTQRGDMTGADRTWAARYAPGDVVHYMTGSKAQGIAKDSHAAVISTEVSTNTITVRRADGQEISYDPRRLKGVNVYREKEIELAAGDRVQFTSSDKHLGLSNRDLGTVVSVAPREVSVKMDGSDARVLSFDPQVTRTFDHGYAVTSHSAQGLTARRILGHATSDSPSTLLNSRLAYVMFSRASEDARLYTDNAAEVQRRLSADVSKTSAIDFRKKNDVPDSSSTTQNITSPMRLRQLPRDATIHEYAHQDSRIAAVTQDYLRVSDKTLIVSPNKREGAEITQLIRSQMLRDGTVTDARSINVLIEYRPSNPLRAETYAVGTVIQYRRGLSQGTTQLPKDSLATVIGTDRKPNILVIETPEGVRISYNPAKQRSSTNSAIFHQPEQRELGTGDRIQFVQSDSAQGFRNRDLATIVRANPDNSIIAKMDNGKEVSLPASQRHAIDYGYSVDGKKSFYAERVLINVPSLDNVADDSALARYITKNGPNGVFYTSDKNSIVDAHHEATLRQQIATQDSINVRLHAAEVASQARALFPTINTTTPERTTMATNNNTVQEQPTMLEQQGLTTSKLNEPSSLTKIEETRLAARENLSEVLSGMPSPTREQQQPVAQKQDPQNTVKGSTSQSINMTNESTTPSRTIESYSDLEIRYLQENMARLQQTIKATQTELLARDRFILESRNGQPLPEEIRRALLIDAAQSRATPGLSGEANKVEAGVEKMEREHKYLFFEDANGQRFNESVYPRGPQTPAQSVPMPGTPQIEVAQYNQGQSATRSSAINDQVIAEQQRRNAPLNAQVPPSASQSFTWTAETGTIQSYKNQDTGRHIHIDSSTGQFYSQEGKPVLREAALRHALPEGQDNNLAQNQQRQSIGRYSYT